MTPLYYKIKYISDKEYIDIMYQDNTINKLNDNILIPIWNDIDKHIVLRQ